MKVQFDQLLMPSFYLFVDDTLVRHGEGYIESNQTFEYADTDDRPVGFLSYYSDDRQFVTNGTGVPNYVTVNSQQVEQNLTGSTPMIIDYDKGRVLIDESVGQSATISGSFDEKEINVYMVDQTEEDIVVNSEFMVSGSSYLSLTSQMGQERYTLPALFLTKDSTNNEPFAFGGMDTTNVMIRAILITENLYESDAATSLLRDCARRTFKTIPYENFPYAQYGTLKDHPYTYTGLVQNYGQDCVYIDEVGVFRLTDMGKSRVSTDLQFNFIDFKVSTQRMPRSQFSN